MHSNWFIAIWSIDHINHSHPPTTDIFHLYVNSECKIFLGFCGHKAFNSEVNRGQIPSFFESVKSILQLKLFCGQTSAWQMNGKMSINDDDILIHIEKPFLQIKFIFEHETARISNVSTKCWIYQNNASMFSISM